MIFFEYRIVLCLWCLRCAECRMHFSTAIKLTKLDKFVREILFSFPVSNECCTLDENSEKIHIFFYFLEIQMLKVLLRVAKVRRCSFLPSSC